VTPKPAECGRIRALVCDFMIDPEILAHYALGLERDRLSRGVSTPIERLRTQEVLARVLPPMPARVLDVGGASGVYASWLAGCGYHVHLIDPVPLHVEQARESSDAGDAPFTVASGDARALEEADETYDAVLLLGPLYHLIERDDRIAALGEASRVVKRGGVVIAAAISRFASLLDGLVSGSLVDPAFASMVEADLSAGVHRNPTNHPEWFTTAYFHRPEELADEVVASGLDLDGVLGVEGPGWLMASGTESDDVDEQVLRVARDLEREPSMVGASMHLLAVARRPA
jgi:ubiquinone/menaquinone biosynthesis C-methylase UbiE